METLLKHVPGFRSKKKWKMIIASIYYLCTLVTLSESIPLFILSLSYPFIFFSFVGIIKTKKIFRQSLEEKGQERIIVNKAILKFIGCMLVFIIAIINIEPSQVNNSNIGSAQNDKVIEAKAPIKTSSIKKVVQAKVTKSIHQNNAKVVSINSASAKKSVINIKKATNKPQKVIVDNKPKTVSHIKESKPAPKIEEPKEEETSRQSENQSATVYITETGKKYHSDGCRYLRKSQIPISLDDAKAGYDPCSKCNPPE